MEHQIRPGLSSLDVRALTRSWQLVPRSCFKILPRILNTNPGEVRAGVWYLGAGTGVERGADVLLQDHARDGILCFGVQGSDLIRKAFPFRKLLAMKSTTRILEYY
jgi:hypothetical protein